MGINSLTNNSPSKVDEQEARKVGKIISAGATLPKAVRMPTTEVGISCKEVAFNTKKVAEEYSASSVLSSS